MFILMNRLNRIVEDFTGAGALNKSRRRELMAEQVQSVIEMVPGLAIGTMIVTGILLFLSRNTGAVEEVAIWSAVLVLLQLFGLRKWLQSRATPGISSTSTRALRSMALHAFVAGAIWGMLPLITVPASDYNLTLVTIVGVTGILCGSGFALAVVPQAALAFVTPLTIGSIIGLTLLENTVVSTAVSVLLVAYLVLIPLITIRYSRNFCSHVIAEIELRDQKNLVSLLLNEYEEQGSDWLWETNRKGRIVRASSRFAEVARVDPVETRMVLMDFLEQRTTSEPRFLAISDAMKNGKAFRDEEIPVDVGGEMAWWKLAGKPMHDDRGEVTGYIGIGSDLTAEKTAEKKISKLAHTDPLTGLLNRASFNEEMERVVAKLERFGAEFTIMFLDLDRFKLINDTRGHLVGDQLLRMVSSRIKTAVREGDYVARLGGDEFAIIMTENCDAGSAAHLATKLIREVSKAYEIDAERHSIGVSIGIALAPMNGTRPNQLLRNADLALYRSKADGRGVFRFFESQMDADEREKRMLELELNEAIDNNEFELMYQPLISTETGLPTCMEALIRWHHPMRGLISPVEFIPIAEQSSLIQKIGRWTIRQACEEAKNWPDDVLVAVNLSAHHFIGSDIVSLTREALETTGLPAHRLELEITESLLINNTEEVLKILRELKDLGINIALDDFGTGYSSLSYILKFPFDKIKIDRSFVKACDEEEAAKSILKMISALGESLDIKITAEGVETEEQVDFLRSINCHQFQGFLFAKPLKSEGLEEFFANRNSRLPAPARTSNAADKVRKIA